MIIRPTTAKIWVSNKKTYQFFMLVDLEMPHSSHTSETIFQTIVHRFDKEYIKILLSCKIQPKRRSKSFKIHLKHLLFKNIQIREINKFQCRQQELEIIKKKFSHKMFHIHRGFRLLSVSIKVLMLKEGILME